jgi:CRISPR-associated exonuclease Cas4
MILEPIPLSLLNDYLYCPRRAALKIIEGWREANEHTERGKIVHEHADLPGYEVANGVKLLRALPVFSERLGLNGKCDIVEQRGDGTFYPVEFKRGKRCRFENDDAQLCAQALCLEDMFNISVPQGAVFHAESKRRREIEFDSALRETTLKAVSAVRTLAEAESLTHRAPAAKFKPACEECSLFEICLPKLTGDLTGVRNASRRLFET